MSASKEFTNPKLVAIYDPVNPIDDKIDFFVEFAKKLQAKCASKYAPQQDGQESAATPAVQTTKLSSQ